MRTIKFRGKDFKFGKWVYGDLVRLSNVHGTGYFIATDQKIAVNETLPKNGILFTLHKDIFMVNPRSVGQFTGLHDKNGKEIYEGDIVKLWFPLSDEKDADLNEVRWNDKLGRYELVFICPFNGKESYLLFYDIENIKVIGNIHDNPELKEGGEK